MQSLNQQKAGQKSTVMNLSNNFAAQPRVQLLGPRILIKPNSSKIGNVPAEQQEFSNEGVVIALGAVHGEASQMPTLAAGDRILFKHNSGIHTSVDGQWYLILNMDEVLGTILGTSIQFYEETQHGSDPSQFANNELQECRHLPQTVPVSDATGYVENESTIQ